MSSKPFKDLPDLKSRVNLRLRRSGQSGLGPKTIEAMQKQIYFAERGSGVRQPVADL